MNGPDEPKEMGEHGEYRPIDERVDVEGTRHSNNTMAFGPTWKWMVGILLSVVGVSAATWATVVWNQLSAMNENVNSIRMTAMQLQDAVSASAQRQAENREALKKLWEQSSATDKAVMELDYRLKVLETDRPLWLEDDRLLHNWIHPDKK